MASPFARAQMMMAAIAAAMSLSGSAKHAAMSNIGPYESRGKGRGKTSPSRHTVAMDRRGIVNKHAPKASRSKYKPHTGAKEQERAKRLAHSVHHTHYPFGKRSSPTLVQMSKRDYAEFVARKAA
ncbi:hypothetical protein PPGU19_011750 [Paraburkholderia sp. PGU19]|uniref:hypothetical protein n=1 Tax=Paraburkholderia sp. PGU19 TaxID=2735434 RepID=UPI0015D9E1B9|nr:hypothetical protein [Paraburkholderia sp. PGU19]BCF96606.1 hypothetical protein PPGU19_011750 [Paraburkholderia sp. PGU19]